MTPETEKPEGATLFTVKADRVRFPAALWDRFRDTAAARGEKWIDVLRRLVERYVDDKEHQP